MFYIIGFISIFVFYIFYNFSKSIAKIFTLNDKNNIPLTGGIYLLIGYLINNFFVENYFEQNFFLIKPTFLISIFFIALLDDKFNLDPYFRLILIVIISSLFINFDNFYIQSLNFKYFGFFYTPENTFINILLPVFCILVFINAFNFTDGINGLAGLLGLSWLLYLGVKFTFLIEIYFILFLFIAFFLILNFSNKMYLGDSGNYIISLTIGYLLIILNKSFPFSLYIEEIFLMLLVPGLDLIRLFYIRIKNKKNPLKGDENHLHHYLVKKLGLTKSLIIYILLVNLPIYLFLLTEEILIFLIIITTTIYFYIIKKFKTV